MRLALSDAADALAGALLLHRLFTVQSGGSTRARSTGASRPPCSCGCEAAAQVGYLDPDFFVYSDEVDFARRLRDAGWRSLYVPAARSRPPRAALHRRGCPSGGSSSWRATATCTCASTIPPWPRAVRWLTAWTYALRALAALVLPGHWAGGSERYWRHVTATLRPDRGEGLREAAESTTCSITRERPSPQMCNRGGATLTERAAVTRGWLGHPRPASACARNASRATRRSTARHGLTTGGRQMSLRDPRRRPRPRRAWRGNRHAAAAVDDERACLHPLVGVKEMRSHQQRRDQHRATPCAAPIRSRPCVGQQQLARDRDARQDRRQLGQPPPFEADCEERAREHVHDREHRHISAAQGDTGARDPEPGPAGGHEQDQQHHVDRQPGGGRGEVARGHAGAAGDHDHHLIQPVQRPAERQPGQRLVGAEVGWVPPAAARSSVRAAPRRTRPRRWRARSRWSRANKVGRLLVALDRVGQRRPRVLEAAHRDEHDRRELAPRSRTRPAALCE